MAISVQIQAPEIMRFHHAVNFPQMIVTRGVSLQLFMMKFLMTLIDSLLWRCEWAPFSPREQRIYRVTSADLVSMRLVSELASILILPKECTSQPHASFFDP